MRTLPATQSQNHECTRNNTETESCILLCRCNSCSENHTMVYHAEQIVQRTLPGNSNYDRRTPSGLRIGPHYVARSRRERGLRIGPQKAFKRVV